MQHDISYAHKAASFSIYFIIHNFQRIKTFMYTIQTYVYNFISCHINENIIIVTINYVYKIFYAPNLYIISSINYVAWHKLCTQR